MNNFAINLKTAILLDPNAKGVGKRLVDIIDGPNTAKRTRILKRLERRARTEGGWSGSEAIDWSTLLSWLLKILPLLLSLLLMFGEEEG